jgi:hypothetical protein
LFDDGWLADLGEMKPEAGKLGIGVRFGENEFVSIP